MEKQQKNHIEKKSMKMHSLSTLHTVDDGTTIYGRHQLRRGCGSFDVKEARFENEKRNQTRWRGKIKKAEDGDRKCSYNFFLFVFVAPW